MNRKQKLKEERRAIEEAEGKARVIQEIKSGNNFTDTEAELIYRINEEVMSGDGTAEGWSYDCDPVDYLSQSINIFELVKSHFKNHC